MKLTNYIGREYIGSISFKNETNLLLINKGLNPILISNGYLTLVKENQSLEPNEELLAYFDSLHEYDVIEITPSGKFTHVINQANEDSTIFITEKCNSNCLMCPYPESIRKTGWLTDGSEIIEIAKHMPENMKHITITGGEPFMIKENMFSVLNILKNKYTEQEILLLTNGRVFCLDSYIEKLKNCSPNNFILGIPLHSYNCEEHDHISSSPGSFKQTVSGISKLIHAGFHIEIRIVVNKLNYTKLIQIASLIIKYFSNVYRVVFIGLEMMGNAAINKKDIWVSYSQSVHFIEKAVDLLVSSEITTKIYNYPLCLVSRNYWDVCDLSISDYKRTYSPECEKCLVKNGCGGLFNSTYVLESNELKAVLR